MGIGGLLILIASSSGCKGLDDEEALAPAASAGFSSSLPLIARSKDIGFVYDIMRPGGALAHEDPCPEQ